MTPRQQKAFSQAIGRGVTGYAALTTLGWALAKAGLATGLGGEDPSDRAVQKPLGGSLGLFWWWTLAHDWWVLANRHLIILGAEMFRTATKPLRNESLRGAKKLAIAGSSCLSHPCFREWRI